MNKGKRNSVYIGLLGNYEKIIISFLIIYIFSPVCFIPDWIKGSWNSVKLNFATFPEEDFADLLKMFQFIIRTKPIKYSWSAHGGIRGGIQHHTEPQPFFHKCVISKDKTFLRSQSGF